MKKNLRYIFSGIRAVLKHEGLKNLISRGFIFLFHRFFFYEDYYVIFMKSHNNPEDSEADFLPRTDGYCSMIITSNREADELVADGFILGAYELNLRSSLDKETIAFCLFVNKEFAHVSCMADNPQGKQAIDPRPFAVNYQNGEVVVSKAFTVPKFRRLLLQEYNGYIMRKYCREKEISLILSSVNARSIPALAKTPKAPDRYTISKCRLIKVLWFKHLKEIKMEPITLNQIVARMITNHER